MTIERTTPKPVATIATFREGLLGGLLGGIVVAGVHFVYDTATATPLRTPALLYEVFLGDPTGASVAQSSIVAASVFTLMHFGAWMLAGLVASLVIALSDAYPRVWYWAFGGTVFVFGSLVQMTAAFEIEGLPSLHLWLGTMLGPAAMLAYLAKRHPGVLKQLDREAITPTEVRDIRTALDEERATNVYYRALESKFGADPEVEKAIRESDGCVKVLLELYEHFDLELPEPSEPPLEASVSASRDEALLQAQTHERGIVQMYDRFLLAVEEHVVREVFVKLRWIHDDEIRPRFHGTAAIPARQGSPIDHDTV